MRYDAVFLDVDGTLLSVYLDVGGYVEDLAPYTTNGPLSVEAARGPVWGGFHEHIRENIKHPSAEGDRAVMVGNDPVSDVRGVAWAGIDAVFVGRRGNVEAPEVAVAVLPDLRGLPTLVAGG